METCGAEEPYEGNPHVRLCGGIGRVIADSTRTPVPGSLVLCAAWVAEHPSARTARAAMDRDDVQRGEAEKVKSCGTVPAAGPVSVVAAHQLHRHHAACPAAPRLPPAWAGVPRSCPELLTPGPSRGEERPGRRSRYGGHPGRSWQQHWRPRLVQDLAAEFWVRKSLILQNHWSSHRPWDSARGEERAKGKGEADNHCNTKVYN